MPEISATVAARTFAALLDAVEHHGEHFTIVRRGKVVAHLEPVSRSHGADIKALLRSRHVDPAWLGDVVSVRDLVELPDRP
ncbi:MAG: hypothetical protein U0U69_07195 [Acidimicrobiia bacterium]